MNTMIKSFEVCSRLTQTFSEPPATWCLVKIAFSMHHISRHYVRLY